MFNLGNTIREINNDRHRKHVSILQEVQHQTRPRDRVFTPEHSQKTNVKTQIIKKDVGTQTYNPSMINISCDTKELEQKEREQKALLAFKKRIEDQKLKAQQMKQFLGTMNNKSEEDTLEDE